MPFDSDRTPDSNYVRPNMRMTPLPNKNVRENDYAFLIQRSNVPDGFTGLINSVFEMGNVVLEPYVDRPYLSNAADITVKNGDRVLINANGNVTTWAATEGQSFTITDIGNKLKTFTPKVLRASGYTFLGKHEDLDLNSVGSAWNGDENYENTLNFICDANKNWIIGGDMKLSDLFPISSPSSNKISPVRFTTDSLLTADPFDFIHLRGKGNIQIGSFKDGEYFTVQWGNNTHTIEVLRPVSAYTIQGQDQDLQLDTADMSIRQIRLTLSGKNFEVS